MCVYVICPFPGLRASTIHLFCYATAVAKCTALEPYTADCPANLEAASLQQLPFSKCRVDLQDGEPSILRKLWEMNEDLGIAKFAGKCHR